MSYPLLCEWTHKDVHVMQPYGVLYNYGHAFCVLQLRGELDGSLRDDLQ
jgi:hypothetical protein